MKLIVSVYDRMIGVVIGKKAITISNQGEPYLNLWYNGYRCGRIFSWLPFCVLMYDKS